MAARREEGSSARMECDPRRIHRARLRRPPNPSSDPRRPSSMAPVPAPALMDELVEEILLRIPPDDPARLLHAALVCKCWGRIVSATGFRRRFRELHRTRAPPMLGFLCNHRQTSYFVPTSSFRATRAGRVNGRAIDVRHGRVLLQTRGYWDRMPWERAFHVWDPITSERRELPMLPPPPGPAHPWSWNAAVLCAVDGCEHRDCHRGPFLVVVVGSDSDRGRENYGMFARVYSSEADAWSRKISALHSYRDIQLEPNILADNVLYFRCINNVLKYDLATRKLSFIHLLEDGFRGRTLLMATEDAGLGLACISSHRLYLWSRKAVPDENGITGWASKVIKLASLLPADVPADSVGPIGFAHGLDVILVGTSVGIFTIDLNSMRVKKVCEESRGGHCFPYMSFCTPALGATASTE